MILKVRTCAQTNATGYVFRMCRSSLEGCFDVLYSVMPCRKLVFGFPVELYQFRGFHTSKLDQLCILGFGYFIDVQVPS